MAVILLTLSLLQIYGGFRNATAPTTPFHVLRGGIGATVGVIVLLEPLSAYLESQAARVILALGWLAYGLLGLITGVATRGEQRIRIGALVTSGIAIVLEIVWFTGDSDDSGRMSLLGWITVGGGVRLLALPSISTANSPSPLQRRQRRTSGWDDGVPPESGRHSPLRAG